MHEEDKKIEEYKKAHRLSMNHKRNCKRIKSVVASTVLEFLLQTKLLNVLKFLKVLQYAHIVGFMPYLANIQVTQ